MIHCVCARASMRASVQAIRCQCLSHPAPYVGAWFNCVQNNNSLSCLQRHREHAVLRVPEAQEETAGGAETVHAAASPGPQCPRTSDPAADLAHESVLHPRCCRGATQGGLLSRRQRVRAVASLACTLVYASTCVPHTCASYMYVVCTHAIASPHCTHVHTRTHAQTPTNN